MSHLQIRPCLDSQELAEANRRSLDVDRLEASERGMTAVQIGKDGGYDGPRGSWIDLQDSIEAGRRAKRSISPDSPLPVPQADGDPGPVMEHETVVQVANLTTLQAARRLVDAGLRPVALNFANGVRPGGGFLCGSRAQEEVLCRCSTLYDTLEGDPMYAAHRANDHKFSSDWAILSPDVPVFANDDGTVLEEPWLLSFLTCAAPVCRGDDAETKKIAGDLLQQRIHRVLAIARAFGYRELVLGAWGCGAFGNDPLRTAQDFRAALEGEFVGAFREVVFAITDWSPERRFVGPFREVFDAAG